MNMYKIIKKAPSFDNDYILFRFIADDTHLLNLKKGDIYIETAFTSTTRNPFLRFILNPDSLILLKIKIPKNIEGIALSIEPYSLYSYENEIILNPCYLKLVHKIIREDGDIYEHINKEVSKLINTIYELEYVKPYDISKHFLKYKITDYTIPFIDFYDIS